GRARRVLPMLDDGSGHRVVTSSLPVGDIEMKTRGMFRASALDESGRRITAWVYRDLLAAAAEVVAEDDGTGTRELLLERTCMGARNESLLQVRAATTLGHPLGGIEIQVD